MGAFVGIFKTATSTIDSTPPNPYNVTLSSGGRIEVGLAPIQGYATLNWEYPGFPYLSHFEVAIVENDKKIEESPILIVAHGITYKKSSWDIPQFDEVKFDGNITGVTIHSLKPNTIYRCAVRAVSQYKSLRSQWVWSNQVKTGDERTPEILDLEVLPRYKGAYLEWEINDYVESVDIEYKRSTDSTWYYKISNYKGTSIFISIDLQDDTVTENYDFKVTAKNFEGTVGTSITVNNITIQTLAVADSDFKDKKDRVDSVISGDGGKIIDGTALGSKFSLDNNTGALKVTASGDEILDTNGNVRKNLIDKDGDVVIDTQNGKIGSDGAISVGRKSITGGRYSIGPVAISQGNYTIGYHEQIDVDDTNGFPDTGTVYFGGSGSISYTGRGKNYFGGCTVSGKDLAQGDVIVTGNGSVVFEGFNISTYNHTGRKIFEINDLLRGYNASGDGRHYIDPNNNLFIFGYGWIDESDMAIFWKLYIKFHLNNGAYIGIDPQFGWRTDNPDGFVYDGDITPYVNESKNLGSIINRWLNIYTRYLKSGGNSDLDIISAAKLVLQSQGDKDVEINASSGYTVPAATGQRLGKIGARFDGGYFEEINAQNAGRVVYWESNTETASNQSASYSFIEYQSDGSTFRDKIIGTFVKKRGDTKLKAYFLLKAGVTDVEVKAKIGYRSIDGSTTTYSSEVTVTAASYSQQIATIDISGLTNNTMYYFAIALSGGVDESEENVIGYLKQPVVVVESY